MPKEPSLSLLLVLLLLLFAVPFQAQVKRSAAAEKAAQQSARSWLALVDSGKYAESWNAASEVFKKIVRRDKWITTIKRLRNPLGKVRSRKLKGYSYSKGSPGAPKEESVTLYYATVCRKKSAAVETVSEVRDKDGKWRLAGYFIK